MDQLAIKRVTYMDYACKFDEWLEIWGVVKVGDYMDNNFYDDA